MSKLLLVVLMAVGMHGHVYADERVDDAGVRNLHHKNFMGQRPYSKAPVAKPQTADEQWEGTGLVTDKPEKSFSKHDQLRLNAIGRRPYVADKSID